MLQFVKKTWDRLDAWAQKVTGKMGLGEDKENFVENLTMLLESGMHILGVLEAIRSETHSKSMLRLIDVLKEEIEGGSSLWLALEKIEIFSPHITALIRIGEESGQLNENLKAIVIQQKKEREFHSKLRSAMMYPALVLGLTLVVGIGIAWFILPRLSTVFDQLKLELPLVTRVLIGFGRFLGDYGTVVIPSFIMAIIIFGYFIFFYKRTKFLGQKLLFVFPGIKNLIREVELARFGYILGALLRAGLPIEKAIDSLQRSATFSDYQKFYSNLKKDIEEGASFQESFNQYEKTDKIIPKSVQQMINVAYQSGHLADTLIKIGEKFESKTENTTKNLSVILEPILLVIVWLGVVAVALAVILPIYNLVGGFNANPVQ